MRILTFVAILWTWMLNAQTIDGDLYTAELTSIAEEANLPGAYKGKVAIAFANYHNTVIKEYPREVVKINALTNRVADAFSITFTLNGSIMESAQFAVLKPKAEPGSAGDDITDATLASDSVTVQQADSYSRYYPEPDDDYVETFMVVEEMPRFPGCQEIDGSVSEKFHCAQKKMMLYIQENVKYQGRAKAQGIEGVVIIQFNVQTDGSLTDITLARGLGYGCDEESFRVVESMNHMDEKWSPGRQHGVPVVVQFTIPIKFPPE